MCISPLGSAHGKVYLRYLMNNEYEIKDGVCCVVLSNGLDCFIDEADIEKISDYNWCTVSSSSGGPYAISSDKSKVRMHRLILDTPKGLCVDHKNKNTLDNTRSNIHNVTMRENALNRKPDSMSSSEYLGVSWCTRSKKWLSAMVKNGKRKHIGYYKDEKEAGIARAKAFVDYYGPELNPSQTKLSKERY